MASLSPQDPPWLQGLNPPQREAATLLDGPVLVLAGAGTGKTRALTARLAQILQDMKTWMVEREYESLAQLKGSMCQTNLRDASMLARQSYIRVLDSFTPRPGVWR